MSKADSNDSSKVIRVVFGPGGGRADRKKVDTAQPTDDLPKSAAEGTEAEVSAQPIERAFSQAETARILQISRAKLRSLDASGVISPTGWHRKKRAYRFQDLTALRAAKELIEAGVRIRDVAGAVASLRSEVGEADVVRALSIASDSSQLVVRRDRYAFEPTSGQLILNFEFKELKDAVIRVLRPRAGDARASQAYDHYIRASRLDESPSTLAEAEGHYRRAIELDPGLAIAYTNLGNIFFRTGEEQKAVALYEKALAIDPSQPEAHYNLGYVTLDRGEPLQSIRYFLAAIERDAKFADAYFNLAMAQEQTGDRAAARVAWQKYLELEPTGTWADIARRHLV